MSHSKILYYFFFSILFFALPSQTAKAQDNYLKFDHITTKNGLPQDHIFCILQDNKGFLWLGTETGLVRYDGYTFKVYENDPEDSTSISSNIIRSIYQDEEGFFWIGTDGGGMCRFDPALEKFESYKNDPQNPNSLSGNRVYEIKEDQNGVFWVATLGNGLNRIQFEKTNSGPDHSKYEVKRFKHDPKDQSTLSNNNIWTMLIDRSNRLWIGTVMGGLNMLDLNEKTEGKLHFKRFQHEPSDPRSLSSNSIQEIYQDKSGTLWIATQFAGLNRFDPETKQFHHYTYDPDDPNSISHNYVSAILEDSEGRFLIGTNGGGLNIFDREQDLFHRYTHLASDPYSLNGDLINTLYQDKMGIIWIGMVMNGLNWIDPQKLQIKHYYPVKEHPESLKGPLVKTVYEDREGQIWVGSYGGGLSRFYPSSGECVNFQANTSKNNSVTYNNVQAIFEDSKNTFWIGTDGGGLHIFDRKNNTFSDFNNSPSGKTNLSGNSVWSICEDIKGNLWVGTADGGLNKFDADKKEFEHFQNDPGNLNTINSHDVRVVYEDNLGILWIGTYGGGLNRYNPNRQEFSHYQYLPEKRESISNDIITDIFESPSTHQLWIGTFGGGLNRFERTSESFKSYREKDGLANDVVKSIEEDKEGNLWISTLKGISKFNPEDETFVNYSIIDGLQGEGFNLGSSCTTQDGAMLFGGTNGFNVFYPETIKKSQDVITPCHLTDLRIFNRSIQPGEIINKKVILSRSIDETRKLVIPHTIDGFAFEFAAMDFARSDKIKYSYRLEGLDGLKGDWKYTDATRRYAAYFNLPAGDYAFKVRASNKEGDWTGQETGLTVQVLSAPWKTWWAYLIYGILGLAAFAISRHFALGRLRLLRQLRKERIQRNEVRQLNEMKLRFFTNISHEIRTPLTLILGPLETLITSAIGNDETRKQLQTMHRNANRLLALVNQLLEFRKQEEGHTKLKIAEGDFVNFIHEITLSFAEFARQKAINFSFSHESKEIPLWYDQNQMEKVFYNLLSNAFKFTPENGKISVKVFSDDKSVKAVVEDNGIGIAANDLPFIFDRFHKFDKNYSGNYLGSGIGLALAKNIVKLHHGTISVESEPKQLTRFIINLQKGSGHFSKEQIVSQFKHSEDASHYQIPKAKEWTGKAPVQVLSDSNAPKMLIVEDNEDVRNYLKEIFGADYVIYEAANGKDGFEKASNDFPDMIISDILMPEMDGIELCRLLKSTIETSHIPVILLTARTSLVFRAEGLDTGADDYVTKPFNPDLLKKRVRNLIESRKRLREKFSNKLNIEPSEITLTSPDQELLKKALEVVEEHLSEDEFDVNMLARKIGLSRPVLYRKLPAITNYTPNEFIRVIRLKRAAQLLSQNVMSVSEVCYTVGFKTPKYFSKCFREFFGVTPSEYVQKNKS